MTVAQNRNDFARLGNPNQLWQLVFGFRDADPHAIHLENGHIWKKHQNLRFFMDELPCG
jgi:hypothetical protein